MLRRLATKDCEIKKSAAINRRYQTANEILIKFVEVSTEFQMASI